MSQKHIHRYIQLPICIHKYEFYWLTHLLTNKNNSFYWLKIVFRGRWWFLHFLDTSGWDTLSCNLFISNSRMQFKVICRFVQRKLFYQKPKKYWFRVKKLPASFSRKTLFWGWCFQEKIVFFYLWYLDLGIK